MKGPITSDGRSGLHSNETGVVFRGGVHGIRQDLLFDQVGWTRGLRRQLRIVIVEAEPETRQVGKLARERFMWNVVSGSSWGGGSS